jgi:hypothetical protein
VFPVVRGSYGLEEVINRSFDSVQLIEGLYLIDLNSSLSWR